MGDNKIDTDLDRARAVLESTATGPMDRTADSLARVVDAATVLALDAEHGNGIEFVYGYVMAVVESKFPDAAGDQDVMATVRGILMENLCRMAARLRACARNAAGRECAV